MTRCCGSPRWSAGDGEAVADRLRLSNAERARLVALRAGPTPRPEDDDASLRRLLADTQADVLIGRVWLAGRRLAGVGGLARPAFRHGPPGVSARRAGTCWRWASPRARAWASFLDAVRGWWLDGGCMAGAMACALRLRALVVAADGGA